MQTNRRQMIVSLIVLACLPARRILADDEHRSRGRRGKRDNDHDYEDADDARRSGDIVPLRDVLDNLRKSFNGEIVGIDFGKEHGLWVYEIKMIAEDGRYIEIYVDAKSNKILKIEGK